MCTKEDNPGLIYIKGGNSREIIVCVQDSGYLCSYSHSVICNEGKCDLTYPLVSRCAFVFQESNRLSVTYAMGLFPVTWPLQSISHGTLTRSHTDVNIAAKR